MTKTHPLLSLPLFATAAVCIADHAVAQAIPVPLAYNFNGIAHAGETSLPDDPNGFRSISDRALDFTIGIPNDPLLNAYQLITSAGTLDLVHLGNRNTVAGGTKAFDPLPDGDIFGIQPAWLANVDQTGPQTTTLTTPLPILPTTEVAFLYQISNGGGAFDVTFSFASGNTATYTLSGGDWFGGPYLGTAGVDMANPGQNLSVTEGRIGMAAHTNEVVTDITFSNASNANAGYAILACNFEYPPAPTRINQIPLAYNFNGIAHTGETGLPDDPIGFRSISDRALDFTAGVPTGTVLDDYLIVDQALALDIVHLGNRNTVDGGNKAFDALPDGDNLGIQPAWLANPDQTGPQTTTLATPIVLDLTSKASLLFLISNGGGSFDIEFQFATGTPVVSTVSGPDWFGGGFAGTGSVDTAAPSANLSVTERSIDLSSQAGRTLTAISFQNASNANAGHAILAMNVIGCLQCANGAAATLSNLGGGVGATIASSSTGGLGCDLDWTISGASVNTLGIWAAGLGQMAVPLASAVPGCAGTIHTPNPVLVAGVTDAFGSATLTIPVPPNQVFCGIQVTAQHYELGLGSCFLLPSDALSISIGN